MDEVRIDLVGMDRLIRLLATGGERAVPALARGLHDEALEVFATSQTLVPFDEGVLSASGQVHAPSVSGGDVVVEITYGGNASAYAAIQHERDDFAHDPGRQSHFLQDPFEAAASGLADRLSDRVDAILRGLI